MLQDDLFTYVYRRDRLFGFTCPTCIPIMAAILPITLFIVYFFCTLPAPAREAPRSTILRTPLRQRHGDSIMVQNIPVRPAPSRSVPAIPAMELTSLMIFPWAATTWRPIWVPVHTHRYRRCDQLLGRLSAEYSPATKGGRFNQANIR